MNRAIQHIRSTSLVALVPNLRWTKVGVDFQITRAGKEIAIINRGNQDLTEIPQILDLLKSGQVTVAELSRWLRHPLVAFLVRAQCICLKSNSKGLGRIVLKTAALRRIKPGNTDASLIVIRRIDNDIHISSPASLATYILPQSKSKNSEPLSQLFTAKLRRPIKDILDRVSAHQGPPLFRWIHENLHVNQTWFKPVLNKQVRCASARSRLSSRPTIDVASKKTQTRLRRLFETKSCRVFSSAALTKMRLIEFLSFFQAQVTNDRVVPKYFYPAAGGIYETKIFIAVHRVGGVSRGFYFFNDQTMRLELVDQTPGLIEHQVLHAVHSMSSQGEPRVIFWIASQIKSLNEKYGDLAISLGLMNAGVVIDRLYLVSQALKIGGCAIGSCDDTLKNMYDHEFLKDFYFLAGYAI